MVSTSRITRHNVYRRSLTVQWRGFFHEAVVELIDHMLSNIRVINLSLLCDLCNRNANVLEHQIRCSVTVHIAESSFITTADAFISDLSICSLGTRWLSGTVPDFAIARSSVRLPPAHAAVYHRQLSVPSLRGRLMSTSESWGVNRHTTRCTSPVSVVLQLRLLSGWGLQETEIRAAQWVLRLGKGLYFTFTLFFPYFSSLVVVINSFPFSYPHSTTDLSGQLRVSYGDFLNRASTCKAT